MLFQQVNFIPICPDSKTDDCIFIFPLTNGKFFECCDAPELRMRSSAKISPELTIFLCFAVIGIKLALTAAKPFCTGFTGYLQWHERAIFGGSPDLGIKIPLIQLGAYGLSR